MPPDAGEAILTFISFFKLVSYDKTTKQASATRYTRKMIDYLKEIKTPESLDDVEDSASGLQEVWVLFVVFVCYFILAGLWRNGWMTSLIICLGLSILVLYKYIHWVYRRLLENSEHLLYILEGVDMNREIEQALKLQGYPVSGKPWIKGAKLTRSFVYNDKTYWLAYERGEGKFTERYFQQLIVDIQVGDGYYILFTNTIPEVEVLDLVAAYGERLTAFSTIPLSVGSLGRVALKVVW